MSKKERRKINIVNVQDVTSLGQISKEELLSESDRCEPENYKPLKDIDKKVVLVLDNKTEVITIRVTGQENELLKERASANRISKSAFLRAIVLKSIRETSGNLDFTESEIKDDLLKSMLVDLSKKIDKIENHNLTEKQHSYLLEKVDALNTGMIKIGCILGKLDLKDHSYSKK